MGVFFRKSSLYKSLILSTAYSLVKITSVINSTATNPKMSAIVYDENSVAGNNHWAKVSVDNWKMVL